MTYGRILSLQPYYGGSHQAFDKSWQANSQFQFETISLPPRHWKWRMRHAAWTMAKAANRLWESGLRWQANFCTDMLNLAEFKGLVRREIAALPTAIYFHENQFVYPNQQGTLRDLHFGVTNFSSALAADVVWFNSAFNRDSMLQSLERLCRKWPDNAPKSEIKTLRERSEIIHPGIESAEETRGTRLPETPLHLIWAARWEHDKGPGDLLNLLTQLEKLQVEFSVSVIGQKFRSVPDEFSQIKSRFERRILNWGFQSSRQKYWGCLASADVFVSTARHEFFGLSAAEAISAGLYPILPNRLAYPELLEAVPDEQRADFLYQDIDEAARLVQNVSNRWERFQTLRLADSFGTRFDDAHQAQEMDRRIFALIRQSISSHSDDTV